MEKKSSFIKKNRGTIIQVCLPIKPLEKVLAADLYSKEIQNPAPRNSIQ